MISPELFYKVCKENGIFDEMGLTNPVNDIIDAAVINRNNWQMYGSRKPGYEAYKLTHLFQNHPMQLSRVLKRNLE